MEPLEFLAGKYQQAEEVISGSIQTFRAREAASGHPVYVHRISSNDANPQEAALLKLILQAIFRSAKAKERVLDFADDSGYVYIVTDQAPQCLHLREWLQLESSPAPLADTLIKDAAPLPAPLNTQPPPELKPPPEVKPPPEIKAPPEVRAPLPDTRNLGEFTRLFNSSKPAAPPPPAPAFPPYPAIPTARVPEPPKQDASEFTRLFQASSPQPASPAPPKTQPPVPTVSAPAIPPSPLPAAPIPAPSVFAPPVFAPPVAPPAQDPGEFTRMFQGGSTKPAPPPSSPFPAMPVAPAPPAAPPPPSTPQSGEFTRFFQGGLPPSASPQQPTARTPDVQRPFTPNPAGFVQRPTHAPVPPPTPGGKSPDGEFTRLFARQTADPANPGMVARKPEFVDPFGDSPSQASPASMPSPPPSQEPGEYTRMFGRGNSLPSATQSTTAPPVERGLNEPVARPVVPAAPKGPSEFTRVIGARPPEGAPPPAASAAPPPHAPAIPAFKPPAFAPPPMPKIPAPPAIAAAAPLAAKAAAAPSSNKTLIIFLAALALVTILIVVLIVLLKK